jgi:hypothetical protein
LSALDKKQYNCTISLPAKLLVGAEAIIPDTVRTVMSFVNVALPSAKHPGPQVSGSDLNPQMNRVFQASTALGKEAARKLNE